MEYKKYKEKSAEDTIQLVRSILHDNGILLKEEHRVKNRLYSCRITLGNKGLGDLNIGTNGKGRTFEYSLASGEAEFLERLQNRIIYNRGFIPFLRDNITQNLEKKFFDSDGGDYLSSFRYDPNEEIWPLDKVMKEWSEDLKLIYRFETNEELYSYFKNELGIDSCAMIPCYSVTRKAEIMMPLELIMFVAGSNGMCAGNTDIEAVLQGFCEIFERYSMSEIYHKQLTPPTLSPELFAGTFAYEQIKYLEEEVGYKIIIKDCSLGQGYPVIGVIIVDQENMLYNFKLGDDFVPHVALERCLTESFQSIDGFRANPITFTWNVDDLGNKIPVEQIEENYKKNVTNGSGSWPISIFSNKTSWDFIGFHSEYGKSNKSDLKISIDLVSRLGLNIYFRDNSFLGFPTYYIVIPGLSELTDPVTLKKSELSSKTGNLHLLSKLGRLTRKETKELIDSLEFGFIQGFINNSDYTRYYLFNTDEDLLNLDLKLMLCMLYYSIEEFAKSKILLDTYLQEDEIEYKYYYAVSTYIKLYRIEKLKKDEVLHILSGLYGNNTAEEVLKDMDNPKEIFKDYSLPSCFNCDECGVRETCRLFSILEIEKKLNHAQIKANIKQFDISNKLEL